MKKFLFVLIGVLTLTTLFAVSGLANENISVWMNGDFLEFDVPPQVINGRTMIPVRTIFENLGAKVNWNNDTQTITSTKGTTTVVMQIDNYTMKVNGSNIAMDTPPQIVDGRTLVPVRAVAEAFGNKVSWYDEYSTVIVSDTLNFNSVSEAHNYLCNWITENGQAFANHISVELPFGKRELELMYIPEPGKESLCFRLSEWNGEELLSTSIFLGKDRTNSPQYCHYINGTNTSRIDGYIDVGKHTPNFPLSYIDDDFLTVGDFETVLNLVEYSRERVNLTLELSDLLLSVCNTGVTLNALGFSNY